MEKLKEIDNFLKYFPQIDLEEDESSGRNKRRNKSKNLEFLNKNGNGFKVSSVNEINQKLNEKMNKINAPKKEKKKRRRGKIKDHGESTKTQNENKEQQDKIESKILKFLT